MTIIEYDNDSEFMEVECNECNETGEFDGSFIDCIDDMKLEGWDIKQVDGEWEHICPDCKNPKKMDEKI